jgi:hypothetical protein
MTFELLQQKSEAARLQRVKVYVTDLFRGSKSKTRRPVFPLVGVVDGNTW